MVKMSYLAWDIQKNYTWNTWGKRRLKHISLLFCPKHSRAIHSQVAIEKENEHAHIDVKLIVSTINFQKRQKPISFCNI
jgi:hypothetical protein